MLVTVSFLVYEDAAEPWIHIPAIVWEAGEKQIAWMSRLVLYAYPAQQPRQLQGRQARIKPGRYAFEGAGQNHSTAGALDVTIIASYP